MIFLDTNVLMYASGADDSSLVKTGIARGLLRTTDGIVLSLQVLQEFYVNATRVTRARHRPRRAITLRSRTDPSTGVP